MAKKKQDGAVTKKKRASAASDATTPHSPSKRSGRPDKDKRSRAKPDERAGAAEDATRKPGKGKKKRQAGTAGPPVPPERPARAATEPRRAVQSPTRTTPPRAPASGTRPVPRSLGDVDGFVAVLESITDPEQRYVMATEELGGHVKAVERLSAVRGDAAAAAYGAGGSVRSLAQRLGVSPSRVHQLIQESQARASRSAPRQ